MAMDISTLSVWAYVIIGVVALTAIYIFVNRGRLYYKKTQSDDDWVKARPDDLYERSLNIAVICGLIIACMTLLFLHYFHDWNGLVGMVIVDLVLILVVAYPARRPMMAVGILALLVLPAAYLDYGPYAAYIVGPIEKITGDGSIAAIPKMAEKNFHCVVILMTNPMAYEQECVLSEQQKAPEEAATISGIEITRYTSMPEKEIYPYGSLELYITFENEGDYVARNFTVVTNTSSGATYRVCQESIFKDLITNGRKYEPAVKKGQTLEYRIVGKVADPWIQEDERCTYAINKKLIDASIKTNFTYDYGTESSLTFEIARSLNLTDHRDVVSALEKSAPMTILMHTFSPISWSEKDFSNRTMYIRLKHDYDEGIMTFRGKYEFRDVVRIGSVIYETLEDYQKNLPVSKEWEWVGQIETYDYCVNKTDTSQIFTDARTAEDCIKKYMVCVDKTDVSQTISAVNASDCEAKDGQPVYREGEPVYKARAKKTRNDGDFDELIVWPIDSGTSEYINLSCGGNMSEETDSGGCICENNLCKIRYVGGQGDLKLSKGDDKLLYTNLMVEVTGFPEDSIANTIKVSLHANATYNVAYERKITLNVLNPHYDK